MMNRYPLAYASIAFLLAMIFPVQLVRAQVLGTVTLPADLAGAGTQIEGVFNKNPQGGAFLAYCEGPAMDSQGNVFFDEHGSTNRIWKVTPAGQGTIFATGNGSNGIEFDSQGRMIVCQIGAIAVFDKDGGRTILSNSGNPNFATLNDVSIGSSGAMFLTNHSSGNSIFFRNSSGVVTTYPQSPNGVRVPNGIEWIEEKKILLVCSSDDNKVYQYDVAENGMISNKRDFAAMPIPDGLTVDEKGNVYVASYGGGAVYVFDATGKELGRVTVKSANTSDNNQAGNTSNCVIGANKILFITGDGGLYKIQLKVGPRIRPGTTGVRNSLLRLDPVRLRMSRSVFDPASQGLAIALPVADGRFAVRIFDARMREVWSATADNPRLEWNGKNTRGELMPSGRYLILARSVGHKAIFASVNIIHK